MTENDLDTVERIEQGSFLSPWSRRAFAHEIFENQCAIPLVAVVQGQICGYLVAWIIADELHIGNIAVDKSWQRQGLAARMLTKTFRMAQSRQCRMAYLEVRRSNLAAQGLYEKFGFQRVSIRPRYYTTQSEDAMVMSRLVKGMSLDGGEDDDGLV
jgi:ribosomal-protein-alanine N-acetyltransferase